jgi:hypothetical protein
MVGGERKERMRKKTRKDLAFFLILRRVMYVLEIFSLAIPFVF